ncbi:hypothetical protein D3C84_975270 [compost metagenome]
MLWGRLAEVVWLIIGRVIKKTPCMASGGPELRGICFSIKAQVIHWLKTAIRRVVKDLIPIFDLYMERYRF